MASHLLSCEALLSGFFTQCMICCFFFFNDTATTEIYTLSLHDALPIRRDHRCRCEAGRENWTCQIFPWLSSSLRTQGPITTGARDEGRPQPSCPQDRPRRMGPCVRRGDELRCGVHRTHHDRNNLVYCVSCRMLARSVRKVALPRSSSDASSARFAVETTNGSSKASTRWLSVCPKGISRAPAEIQFEVSACRKACMVGASGIACAALTRPTATGYTIAPPHQEIIRSSPSQFHAARAISMNARPCADVSSWRSRDGTKAAASSAMPANAASSHDVAARCACARKTPSQNPAPSASIDASQSRNDAASPISPASTAHSMPLEYDNAPTGND